MKANQHHPMIQLQPSHFRNTDHGNSTSRPSSMTKCFKVTKRLPLKSKTTLIVTTLDLRLSKKRLQLSRSLPSMLSNSNLTAQDTLICSHRCQLTLSSNQKTHFQNRLSGSHHLGYRLKGKPRQVQRVLMTTIHSLCLINGTKSHGARLTEIPLNVVIFVTRLFH